MYALTFTTAIAQSCSSSDISIAWTDTFDSGHRNDIGYGLAAIDDDEDGQKDDGLVIVGTTDFVSSPKTDGFIVRLSKSGVELWRDVIGGNGNDVLNSVMQASNGNIIICGWKKSNAKGTGSSPNVWVLEYDTTGTLLGEHHYGGSGQDEGWKIIEDIENEVYVVAGRAGYVEDPDDDLQYHESINGAGEYWVFTIDRNTFNIGWEQIYHGSYTGGTGEDWATSILIDDDGNYLVSGFCASCDPLKVQWEAFVLNLDPSDGSVNWSGVYGYNPGFGSRDQGTYEVIEVNEGGDDYFVAAGVHHPSEHASCFGNYQHDAYGLKFDDSGNDTWTPGCELSEGKNYGGEFTDNAYAIIPVCDGDYLLAGNTKSPSGEDDVTCNTDGTGPYTSDAWLLKLNSDGSIAWDASLGDLFDDEFHSIIQLEDGSLVAAGEYGADAANELQNFYIVKFELSECNEPTNLQASTVPTCKIKFQWDGTACAYSYQLRYRISGTTSWNYVNTPLTEHTTGQLTSNAYEWQVRTKCSPNVFSDWADPGSTYNPCARLEQDDLERNDIVSVYPNPSDGHFAIELIISTKIGGDCVLEILDPSGIVLISAVENMEDGVLRKNFDVRSLPVGFYLLQLLVNEEKYFTKLIIH